LARRAKSKKRYPRRVKGSRKRSRFLLFAMVALAVVIGAGWLGYKFWSKGVPKKVEAPSAEISPGKKVSVVLYFGDEQQESLVPETRDLTVREEEGDLATLLVEELIKGPRSSLQPTIPRGTKLNRQVICQGGICQVDFSAELISGHPKGTSSELMTIYSVVETLRENVPGVRGVRFLVDGSKVETIAGHIFVGETVLSNPAMIKEGGARSP